MASRTSTEEETEVVLERVEAVRSGAAADEEMVAEEITEEEEDAVKSEVSRAKTM